MELSKILMSLGAVILVMGLLLKYTPWLLNWFGKLPGDIRIQSQDSFIFIPITSMIVVSALLTLAFNWFFKD